MDDSTAKSAAWPGPTDVDYFTQAQAGGWGDMLAAFARFVDLPPGSSVLDAGAGPGLLPRLLADGGARLAVGCDDSLAMVRRAVELAERDSAGLVTRPRAVGECANPQGLVWLAGDALRLPFAAAAFDAAVATNLLFLLPDPAAGLLALARVVRPGGIVAFLNPADTLCIPAAEAFMDVRGIRGFDRFSFVNYARLAEAHHRLPADAWLALARDAGLVDLRVETRAGGLVLFVRGVRKEAS